MSRDQFVNEMFAAVPAPHHDIIMTSCDTTEEDVESIVIESEDERILLSHLTDI